MQLRKRCTSVIVSKCKETPEPVYLIAFQTRMKTLVILTCLLTISYAADLQTWKIFYGNVQNCLNEFNVPDWTPDADKCMYTTYGAIDEQGAVIIERVFKYYENFISDKAKFSQAKEMFTTCHDQANKGPGSNDEKTMMTIRCAMPIKYLMDKPPQ